MGSHGEGDQAPLTPVPRKLAMTKINDASRSREPTTYHHSREVPQFGSFGFGSRSVSCSLRFEHVSPVRSLIARANRKFRPQQKLGDTPNSQTANSHRPPPPRRWDLAPPYWAPARARRRVFGGGLGARFGRTRTPVPPDSASRRSSGRAPLPLPRRGAASSSSRGGHPCGITVRGSYPRG